MQGIEIHSAQAIGVLGHQIGKHLTFENVLNLVVVQLQERGSGHLVCALHQHQNGPTRPLDRRQAKADQGLSALKTWLSTAVTCSWGVLLLSSGRE